MFSLLAAGCGGGTKAEAEPAPAADTRPATTPPPAALVVVPTPNTPPPSQSTTPPEVLAAGAEVFGMNCAQCHTNGEGDAERPPLIDAPGTTGPAERTIRAVLKGVSGPLEVRGRTYNGIMPAQDWLSDEEVSSVVTYVRQKFGAQTTTVTPEEVARVRAATQ